MKNHNISQISTPCPQWFATRGRRVKSHFQKGQASLMVLVFAAVVGTTSPALQHPASSLQSENACYQKACIPAPQYLAPTRVPAQPVVQPPVSTVQRQTQLTGNEVLECIKKYESGGNYAAVNSAGYYGAYQFGQGTWNSNAAAIGRNDLVGVNPAAASPADQDAVATALLAARGLQPWPTPSRMCL